MFVCCFGWDAPNGEAAVPFAYRLEEGNGSDRLAVEDAAVDDLVNVLFVVPTERRLRALVDAVAADRERRGQARDNWFRPSWPLLAALTHELAAQGALAHVWRSLADPAQRSQLSKLKARTELAPVELARCLGRRGRHTVALILFYVAFWRKDDSRCRSAASVWLLSRPLTNTEEVVVSASAVSRRSKGQYRLPGPGKAKVRR